MSHLRSLTLLLASALGAQAGGQSVSVAPGFLRSIFHVEPPGTLLTSLTRDDVGRLYALAQNGVIKVLQDTDFDHVADLITTYFPGTLVNPQALGILWFQGSIYLNHGGTLTRLTDTDQDLVADLRQDLVTGLPYDLTWHQNNDIFTDGTYLYFGLGSVSDHATDPDPRSATLQRYDPATGILSTFATGLRNVFDGAVHPVTGHIFVGDNGPNYVLGNPDPPDELNWVQSGQDYGHPQNWGIPPQGSPATAPIGLFPPHASPVGMLVSDQSRTSGFRHELVHATFGGAVGTLTRIPVFYGPQSGQPFAWITAGNIVAIGSGWLPIDVEPAPSGGWYVLNYLGQVEEIRPRHPYHVVAEGPPVLGSVLQLDFLGPAGSGHQIFAAASLSLAPSPIPLAPGVDLNLEILDPVFDLSITPMNGIFQFPQPQPLDPQGHVAGSFAIPAFPPLAGLSLHIQAAAFDASLTQVQGITPPLLITLVPPF
jgi:glucose/arabinose dehydrogenase